MPETAKQKFLQSPHALQLQQMVLHPAVIAGLDAALLSMTEKSFATDPMRASAAHFQLQGAIKFRDLFLSIAFEGQKTPKLNTDNLNEA